MTGCLPRKCEDVDSVPSMVTCSIQKTVTGRDDELTGKKTGEKLGFTDAKQPGPKAEAHMEEDSSGNKTPMVCRRQASQVARGHFIGMGDHPR